MLSWVHEKLTGSPSVRGVVVNKADEIESDSDDRDDVDVNYSTEINGIGNGTANQPFPRFRNGMISKTFDSASFAAKVEEQVAQEDVVEDDEKELISSTGYITRLAYSMPKGVIDRTYQFDTATFCVGSHKFSENVKVDFKAFRSKSTPAWTVTWMQVHVSEKQEKAKETLRNKTIIVPVVGITYDHIEVKWGDKHSHQIPKIPGIMPNYKLKNGDWLKIHLEQIYPDEEGGDQEELGFDETKVKIISIEPNRMKTIVGKITRKYQEICVDDEIYVTQDIIPNGRSIPLGTLVRCVAVDSSQKVGNYGEFPWRAVEIAISNFMQYTSDPHNRDEGGFFEDDNSEINLRYRDLYLDRGGIVIKPDSYIKFPATKLRNSVAKSITVTNRSVKTIVFQDLIFPNDKSICQFDLILPQKESDAIRTLSPDESFVFQVSCTPLQMGRTKEMGVFDFVDFKIARDFVVTGLSDEVELLNKIKRPDDGNTRPYYQRVRGEQQVSKVMMDNQRTRIRGSAPVRAPFFLPRRIPRYSVPNAVWESFSKQSETLLTKAFPKAIFKLSFENYKERLQVALWFEEVDNDLRRRQYDMRNVRLRRTGAYYTFNCPGLFDFTPPVLIGDPIEVFAENDDNSGVKYQGFIKKLDKTDVYADFSETFNETYRGVPMTIRFCLGRMTFKRQHYALEAAWANLGEEFLFPFGFLDVCVKDPRIPFIEVDGESSDSDDETEKMATQLANVVAIKEEDEHEPVGLFNKQEASASPFTIKKKSKDKGRRAVSLRTPFQSDAPTTKFLSEVKLKWFNKKLNEEQKNAVRRILRGQARPLPYIIYGPPGTGKTVTVVEAIMQVNKLDPNSRVLVTAPTNHAADVIAEHLVNSGKYHPGEFIRFNGFMRQEQVLIEAIKDYCVDGEFLDSVARNRLIISTCTTPGQFFSLNLTPGHFTHVFIDEAGYCTEPESLISAVHLSLDKGGQLILAGDPNQLGPVLMSDVSAQMDLKISFLERLMQGRPGVPNIYARDAEKFIESNCGYNPFVLTKLVRNYRAHPSLLKLPSRLFYNDDLVSCAADAYDLTQDLRVREKVLLAQGVPLVFHGVQGNSVRERDSPSWCNAAEVMQVVDYVRKLKICGLKFEDIGIITPYRKQAEKLRSAMKLGLLEDEIPKVGSVEEFQGGERKVVIISTVRSLYEDKVDSAVNKLGFIFNEKRFNVAITRAKSLMIVVGNPHVLVKDKRWNDLLRYALELRAYTGCNLPPELDEVTNRLYQELKEKEKMPVELEIQSPTTENGMGENEEFEDAEADDDF